MGLKANTARAEVHSSGFPRCRPQKVAPTVISVAPRLMVAPVRVQYRLSRVLRSQLVAMASPPATKAGW